MVGNEIEILAHLDFRIVRGIVGAVAATTAKGGTGEHCQVFGVNVVGVYVVRVTKRRSPLLQTFDRQPIGRINPWDTQDADDNAAAAEGTQLALGVDATTGAGGRRPQASRLVYAFALAVAVYATGTYIHDSLW